MAWKLKDMSPDAIEFCRVFGAFEYAMKRVGFAENGAEGSNAKANWTSFEEALGEDLFAAVAAMQPTNLMIQRPPGRLTLQQAGPQWDYPDAQVMTTKRLMRAVRDARNNLFHGEKYGTERDEALLRAGTDVLNKAREHTAGKPTFVSFNQFLHESLTASAQ